MNFWRVVGRFIFPGTDKTIAPVFATRLPAALT
jgi:hypothetical protein